MDLTTPIGALPGIGPSLKFKLSRLEINTVKDLLYHFPFRYDDFSQQTTILDAQIGEVVTLKGEIWSIKNIYTRSRKILTTAIFNDGTSPLELTWFNQSWITKQLAVGDHIQLSGKLTKYKNKLSIMSPKWEKVDGTPNTTSQSSKTPLHTGKLIAIYPETDGLTSKWFRTRISNVFELIKDQLVDPLPSQVRRNMPTIIEAMQMIHFPKNLKDVEEARTRLGFDELFFVMLATQKMRSEWQTKPVIAAFKPFKEKVKQFQKTLPFELTRSQQKVLSELFQDLTDVHPMNRLIQGEVGSGKTVVAAIAAYLAHLTKLQTIIMAPTEILAFQHYQTISKLLEPLGITVGIYTGSKKFNTIKDKGLKIKKKIHKSLIVNHQSMPNILIGTHALLSDKLNFGKIGLIIVGEQQRFGVEQRAFLRTHAHVPHFLTMTATPIPRTVALTLYGDLDLSVIDELPKNRLPIKTYVVPKLKREDAYKFIEKKVKEGDQVYLITPLIEESETLKSVRSAVVEFQKLQKDVFPSLRLALLHGRLKSSEKDTIMSQFKQGSIDILVSTSVVEVGVDIPNATIMVIESSERFGLAQLHQLRGRVGRGEKQSFCLLFTDHKDPQVTSRLKNMEKISDGLKLAELDLKIRGSGEIFGKRQSGRFEFKIASFSNLTLFDSAKKAAQDILEDNPTLDKYPSLAAKLHNLTSNVMPD